MFISDYKQLGNTQKKRDNNDRCVKKKEMRIQQPTGT